MLSLLLSRKSATDFERWPVALEKDGGADEGSDRAGKTNGGFGGGPVERGEGCGLESLSSSSTGRWIDIGTGIERCRRREAARSMSTTPMFPKAEPTGLPEVAYAVAIFLLWLSSHEAALRHQLHQILEPVGYHRCLSSIRQAAVMYRAGAGWFLVSAVRVDCSVVRVPRRDVTLAA